MAGNQQVSYTCCSPLKRESIVRMMTVNHKNAGSGQQQQPVSLVMVSAKGRVAVYDLSLKLAAAFTLRMCSAPVASIKTPLSIPSAASRTSGSSRRPSATTSSTGITYNAGSSQKTHLNGWITDCIHMDEFSSLVVASSGRCLHFFTTVVTPFVERFRLDGMKDIPTSLAYMAPVPEAKRVEPLLGVGDDGGDVFVLRFLKASTSLFKKREADGEIQHVYWRELHLQAGMVTLSIMPGCHESPVLQVDLKPTMSRVVSCSKSSSTSLLIRHLRPQSGGIDNPVAVPSVILRTGPGITCFDYDDEKGLIVTGSTDGMIRTWSATHLAKPWMVLTGHAATIAAVCLVKQSDFLWSLSDQAELRYWDLNEGKCLNTIHLAFSTGNREDRVQFGCQRPLLASERVLYIACGDSVASVQLSQSNQDGQGPRIVEALLGRAKEEEPEETGMGAESKIPYCFREGLLDFGYHTEDEVFDKFIANLKKIFADSITVTERLKEVENAGVKSLTKASGEEIGPVYDWEVELPKEPPTATKLVPLNQIKLKELEGKKDMKKHVKDGTPFCGLRLHEPSQIELPKGLPVTGRMKKHGIKSLSSLKEVREANFDLFSDQMFSLSSARTSLLSSVLSYYKKKRIGDKVTPAGDSDLLMVSIRSQQSSRKSSISSSLSPYSSGASMEE
ncbi:uncharacterized protein LOC130693241 isoform X2 [Daphnia carinata]|uniref:uncharacterized protein LOC130693241 isoform X2 n=1 Tax=Daphnia carinata TaxID=120202 RepID=UPI00257C2A81|nr:uncharacterized protein LOC130693241 isoform X2 [Daphnia carinata]